MQIKVYTKHDKWLGNVEFVVKDGAPTNIKTIGILDRDRNDELAAAIANCGLRMQKQGREMDVLRAMGHELSLRLRTIESPAAAPQPAEESATVEKPKPTPKRRGRPRKTKTADAE